MKPLLLRALFAATLFNIGVAHAAVIEQSAGVIDVAIFAFDPIGQSFVAEDPLLGEIAFSFTRSSNNTPTDGLVTMTLYEGAGFGGSAIGTDVLDLSAASLPDTFTNVNNFIDFDFSGVGLTVGQTYTAAVTASDPSIFLQYIKSDVYASGQLFDSRTDNLLECDGGLCELDFRVTPSAIPVPAAAWLFGSALLGLGVVKRKKA